MVTATVTIFAHPFLSASIDLQYFNLLDSGSELVDSSVFIEIYPNVHSDVKVQQCFGGFSSFVVSSGMYIFDSYCAQSHFELGDLCVQFL